MKDAKGMGKPFDVVMTGQTVEAHGVMVTPVARVRGQAGADAAERGNWRFAWAAIRPTKMTVQDVTGQTSEVKLEPTEGQVLMGMAAAGLVVAALALLISLIARQR